MGPLRICKVEVDVMFYKTFKLAFEKVTCTIWKYFVIVTFSFSVTINGPISNTFKSYFVQCYTMAIPTLETFGNDLNYLVIQTSRVSNVW